MGTIRNGARTFLNLLAKCCKLSHLPGFRTGINHILGDGADAFFVVWDPLCAVVDTLIAADDWYNQIDRSGPSVAGSEDIPV
jgi:hypothetical protein